MACAYKECTDLWTDYKKKQAIVKDRHSFLFIHLTASRDELDELKQKMTDEIEKDLTFLGFVGIQDELQDGVRFLVLLSAHSEGSRDYYHVKGLQY